MAMLFAATHPERTDRADRVRAGREDRCLRRLPARSNARATGRLLREVRARGGHRPQSRRCKLHPLAGDERFTRWWARFERLVASPSGYEDAREDLSRTRTSARCCRRSTCPTLVLQRTDDAITFAEQGRYVAEQIAGRALRGAAGRRTTSRSRAMPTRCSMRSSGSSRGAAPPMRVRHACWPRCSSPTSSARPRSRLSLGDRAWKELVERHHGDRARDARALPRARGRHRGRRLLRDVRRTRARDPMRAGDRRARSRPLGIEVRAGVHTGECRAHRRQDAAGSPWSIGARGSAHRRPVRGARRRRP